MSPFNSFFLMQTILAVIDPHLPGRRPYNDLFNLSENSANEVPDPE